MHPLSLSEGPALRTSLWISLSFVPQLHFYIVLVAPCRDDDGTILLLAESAPEHTAFSLPAWALHWGKPTWNNEERLQWRSEKKLHFLAYQSENQDVKVWSSHLFIYVNQNSNFFKKVFYVYLFFRERQSTSKGQAEGERGKDRLQSRLQALSCQHRAWCGAQTHKMQGHGLSRSRTPNLLSRSGAPRTLIS